MPGEYGRTRRDVARAEPFCDKHNERLDKKTRACICHTLQTGRFICEATNRITVFPTL